MFASGFIFCSQRDLLMTRFSKTLLAVLAFCACGIEAQAQQRGRHWAVSDSIGIDFGTYSVYATKLKTAFFMDNVLQEPMATVSTENGDLLFYTNSVTVWNANHQVIADSLAGSYTATNGTLILPSLTDSNRYLVFTLNYGAGLFVTTVDVTLNGGEGGAVPGLKNVNLLADTVEEKLLAVRHANGRDWWLLACEAYTNGHFILHYSPQGIALHQKQFIGSPHNAAGEIAVDTSGSLIALCSESGDIDVYDFDRCSGTLSNFRHLSGSHGSMMSAGPYGCSVSPGGTKIYYSNYDTLFQITVDSGGALSSPLLLWINPYPSGPTFNDAYGILQHELGPDGNIYLCYTNKAWPNSNFSSLNTKLCVINEPELAGAACDFQPWSFDLYGKRATTGLPNMPNYNLGKLVGSACDTLTSTSVSALSRHSSFEVYPNPSHQAVNLTLPQGTTQIEIFNAVGQSVYKSSVKSLHQAVDVSLFSEGVYFVRVQSHQGVQTEKFVVQR